ncbi:hypothetical protein AURDEDRAFT_155918 [Auricularia subglabra TFB-10046 SS5]|nr:hypothetical protein AURDEDRAFT_155918 [Auricularia subglabra TFB-10046 SS5]
MMSPSTQPQSHIGDLSSSAGYDILVRKLRLLKYEREGADKKGVTCAKFLLGSQPRPQTLVQSLRAIAKSAYERNARKTQNMHHLLDITLTNPSTPAMSRSSSYASSENSVESASAEPMPIEVYPGKPRMQYECLHDEWVEAERWVDNLVNDEEELEAWY